MSRTIKYTRFSFLVCLQCFLNGYYDQNVCNDRHNRTSEISIIDIRIEEINVIVYLGTKN